MLHRNKKALSAIVGYTLLIIIVVSLAALAYPLLKLYLPKEQLHCEDDINLIVQNYLCTVSENQLNLTLSNKGLFKADAAYVRFGPQDRKIKAQINQDNFLLFNPDNSPGLNPGEEFPATYNVSAHLTGPGQYGLEVQPAVIIEKQLVVCEKSVITQPIECE